MPQAVTIRSLPRAFEFVKAVQADGLEWGEGYRDLGREAIAAVLQGQMAQAIDDRLSCTAAEKSIPRADARCVVLARKTGAGVVRRPVLVAFGLRHDGKKEVVDFRLAHSEGGAEWGRFLGDLIRRGLVADGLEMICVDGGAGLLAALPTAYPGIPVQRCCAHYADLRIMPTGVRNPSPAAVIAAMGSA